MNRILIIEDDEMNLVLLKELILILGHEVIEARDGINGVRLAIEKLPDLILMELEMAELNGIKVMTFLKSEGIITSHIPIIAVTSFYDKYGGVEQLILEGFDNCIQKPINVMAFIEAVQKALKNNKTDALMPSKQDYVLVADSNLKIIGADEYLLEGIWPEDNPATGLTLCQLLKVQSTGCCPAGDCGNCPVKRSIDTMANIEVQMAVNGNLQKWSSFPLINKNALIDKALVHIKNMTQ